MHIMDRLKDGASRLVRKPKSKKSSRQHPKTDNGPKSLIGEVISSVQSQKAGDIHVPPMTPSQPSASDQTGPFTGAHDFVLTNPSFNSRRYTYIMSGQPVLEHLRSAGTPEAGLNSAARYPIPRCYPGTRKSTQEKLLKWLLDMRHEWRMIWLFGAAGVGKSAVAQTFAEAAKDRGLLAATYFFSSTQGERRSDPLRIIPTIAYQMAIHSHHYKSAIARKLASDPSILDATLEAQFRGLIEEPFLQLSSHGLQPFSEAFHVIVVDGLDECSGDEAQCQLVELIKEAAQKTYLPLLWLICSRPERHLKSTFSQIEYAHVCSREELIFDNELRADVERFMRARFKEIHHKYRDTIGVSVDNPWPTESDLTTVMEQVSGHFVVASVAERYVGDPSAGDPEAQLISLLSMLRGLGEISASNPLEALDIFYYRILSKVSESAFPTVTQALALLSHDLDSIGLRGITGHRKFTTEELWLFLRINQPRFYSIMQRLHSVVDIPPPEDASNRPLAFYHKSFPDYLTSLWRSGRYFVSWDQARQCQLACTFHWYSLLLQFNNPILVMANEHQNAETMLNAWFRGIPNRRTLSNHSMALVITYEQYDTVPKGIAFDSDLFNVLHNFDFRLMVGHIERSSSNILPMFAVNLARDTRASPHFARTKIEDEIVDPKLLHHLSVLTYGRCVEPLDLKVADSFNDMNQQAVRFVIVGNGAKSGLACIAKRRVDMKDVTWTWQVIWLSAALLPASGQKLLYRKWAEQIVVSFQQE
ncbi:hypothetical protein D9756_001251 [Leucocoprinus leucothites]|uniref:NACHT domain-containing protein n=1 Tax=Leucocoprinus leucothites TaxID=201217 RepID=A0A8H5LIE9_9AGAR|nr:hypothetical protein D9756_001251 [Leucoagaricus leucothites]